GDERRGMFGEVHPSHLRQLLHALREPDRVPLRRVVHAEIVADPADDHLHRVEPHADGEVEAARAAELVGVSAHGLLQMQGGPAGAPGVVLVRDRCAEERHDAVAGVLVHRTLEAVHALGEDREEAIQDPVPLLGVDLLGQLHRAFHVGEEDRHLLPLAFEGGARGEDLLGEVRRRVGAGGTLCRTRGLSQALAAAVAELLARRIRLAAAGARRVEEQTRAALATEAGTVGIRVVTAGAFHRTHQLAAEAPTAGATDGSTPRPPTWPSAGGVSSLAVGTRAATCAGASDGARVTLTVRSSDLLADYLPLFPLERRHGDPAPLLGRPDQGGVHELQHRALPESVRDHLHPAPFFAEEPFQEICGPNHLAMTNGEAQMCRARREVLPKHWTAAGSSRAYREAKSSRSALASSGEGVSYAALARA